MSLQTVVSIGEYEVPLDLSPGDGPVVILAHGAGGNMDSKNILRLQEVLIEVGVRVARFNFIYRQHGRGIPDKMPVLMETYRAVLERVRTLAPGAGIIVGGHSMGGRVASMLASEGLDASGLLLFSYPLHPVGKPQQLRDAHLPQIQIPTLCINGTQDEFCTRDLMEAVLPRLSPKWTMHWVESADHSLEVRRASGRNRAEVTAELKATVDAWIHGN